MTKGRMDNLDFLLDKREAEKFLKENFFSNNLFEVISLKRSGTFDKKSYNILYNVKIDDKKEDIRLYLSVKHDVNKAYNVMHYLYRNGFDSGKSRVPKPYGFSKKYVAMVYKNIPGQTLMHELDKEKNRLIADMKLVGETLRKFHQLPIPTFEVKRSEYLPGFKISSKFYPGLEKKTVTLKKEIFNRLAKNKKKAFCHGDFQPNNVIVDNNSVYVIDFGSTDLNDKELDIASFVIQLQIMLKKFGNIEHFDELKKVFLSAYDDYDDEKLNLLASILSIGLLGFFTTLPEFENNQQHIPFVYQMVQEYLAKIGMAIVDDKKS